MEMLHVRARLSPVRVRIIQKVRTEKGPRLLFSSMYIYGRSQRPIHDSTGQESAAFFCERREVQLP